MCVHWFNVPRLWLNNCLKKIFRFRFTTGVVRTYVCYVCICLRVYFSRWFLFICCFSLSVLFPFVMNGTCYITCSFIQNGDADIMLQLKMPTVQRRMDMVMRIRVIDFVKSHSLQNRYSALVNFCICWIVGSFDLCANITANKWIRWAYRFEYHAMQHDITI